jgi:DNA-binding transcriptional MocR family regulator
MSTALDLLLVRGDKALHLQLADQIQDRILSGALSSGAKLPTIRELAASAKVSRVTALQAYETLQGRGLVECRVGSGTYVTAPMDRKNGRERLRSFSACAVRTDFASTAQSSGIVNLATADADEGLFHSDEFVAGMLRRGNGNGAEVGLYGSGPLLTALQQYYQGFGIDVPLDGLQVTGGGVATNAVLADSLGHSGARIVLQDPCFPFAQDYFASFKTEPVGVPTVKGDLDTERFHDEARKGDVKAAFLTLTANQCTGESASVENEREVLAIADRYGIPVFEDVSAFWVTATGARKPWLWELANGASIDVVAYDCMSKVLSPHTQIAAVFAKGRTRERIAVRSLGFGSSPSYGLQKALATFIQSRAMSAHLTRNLPRYLARRQAMVGALKEYMPRECAWSVPEAGFCVWLGFPARIDDLALYEAGLAAGVGVSPGMAASVPRRPAAAVRLSYACAAVDEIAIAVKRLGHLVTSRLS